MALSALESSTIARAIANARRLIEEIKPILDGLNIVYNSAGGAKTTITQASLDAATNLSGLTKGQLDDAMFVLTGTLLGDLTNGYTALAQLAARG